MTSLSDIELAISLVAGSRKRVIYIAAITDPSRIPRHPSGSWAALLPQRSAEDLVSAFCRAVDAGCFAGGGAVKRLRNVARNEGARALYEEEIAFPALPHQAFAVLLRMAEASAICGSGLLALTLRETAPHELARVTREELAALPPPEPPFEVERTVGSSAKTAMIAITFAEPAGESTIAAARELLQAWAGVLDRGGFPGEPLAFSAGGLVDVAVELPARAVGTIEPFHGSVEAWDALLRGIGRLHEAHPVARVEMT
jgi:hypothetical protein